MSVDNYNKYLSFRFLCRHVSFHICDTVVRSVRFLQAPPRGLAQRAISVFQDQTLEVHESPIEDVAKMPHQSLHAGQVVLEARGDRLEQSCAEAALPQHGRDARIGVHAREQRAAAESPVNVLPQFP